MSTFNPEAGLFNPERNIEGRSNDIITRYPSGRLKERYEVNKKKQKDGLYRMWGEDRKLKEKSYFSEGKRDGRCDFFDSDVLGYYTDEAHLNYENGVLEGPFWGGSENSFYMEGECHNNEIDGLVKFRAEEREWAVLYEKGVMKEYREDGKFERYNEEGHAIEKGTYSGDIFGISDGDPFATPAEKMQGDLSELKDIAKDEQMPEQQAATNEQIQNLSDAVLASIDSSMAGDVKEHDKDILKNLESQGYDKASEELAKLDEQTKTSTLKATLRSLQEKNDQVNADTLNKDVANQVQSFKDNQTLQDAGIAVTAPSIPSQYSVTDKVNDSSINIAVAGLTKRSR